MANPPPLSRAFLKAQAKASIANAGLIPLGSIFISRVQPVDQQNLPAVLIYSFRDRGDGIGAGGVPQFAARPTIVIEARLKHEDAQQLEQDMDAMADGILNAVLSDPAFINRVEECTAYDMQFSYRDDVEYPQGSVFVGLDLKYRTTFPPEVTQVLAGVRVVVDALNVTDAHGTYQPLFSYTVPEAPRSTGPDGRAEGGASIDLPAPE